MTVTRHPAAIHLWSADIAGQQLAFAHLLDAADRHGATLDLDSVEIVPVEAAPRRLAPYLGRDIPDLPGPMIVLLAAPPGAAAPFEDTSRLTYHGVRAGHVPRAGTAWA